MQTISSVWSACRPSPQLRTFTEALHSYTLSLINVFSQFHLNWAGQELFIVQHTWQSWPTGHPQSWQKLEACWRIWCPSSVGRWTQTLACRSREQQECQKVLWSCQAQRSFSWPGLSSPWIPAERRGRASSSPAFLLGWTWTQNHEHCNSFYIEMSCISRSPPGLQMSEW